MAIEVYTLEEVADILKLSKRTVYTYVHEGKLPASKIGAYWRITEEQLREFLNHGAGVAEGNRRRTNQDKKPECP